VNETKDNTTLPPSDMESHPCDAPLGTETVKGFNSPVSISVHSIRKRLCDIDGISAKAVIDGLVHAKILIDDTPQYVKEVRFSQAKGSPEITIIEVSDE
jgi:hypothetical protein